MTAPIEHRITARNTARSSPNKMHDDDVARSYGFAGGLVPGVTVFAWMCGPPISAFGPAWLEAGRIAARFSRPVYEGDVTTITGTADGDALRIEVVARSETCATGVASVTNAPLVPELSSFRRAPLPAELPAASAEVLVPGTALGTVDVRFSEGSAREYLSSIGADHPLPVAVAHPGWLILLGNLALSNNVKLGPWIHVSSDMQLLSRIEDGDTVSGLSRVAATFERKDHRFVELDVLIVAAGTRPAATIRHVAIYEPRRTR
jgi:hypothetical protein